MTDLPASTHPAAAAHPHVQGRCPACNRTSLFLGSGGHVTCARLDCPNPTLADDQLHRGRPATGQWLLEGTRDLSVPQQAPAFTYRAVTPEMEQAATERARQAAEDSETTTRVFAALHRSAEDAVTRVIDLYEQWVKAGPPPLGTLMARWWDRRLVELHNAIRPPEQQRDADQTKEQQ